MSKNTEKNIVKPKKEYEKPKIESQEFDDAQLMVTVVCDGTTGGPDKKKVSGMGSCTTKLS